MGRTQRRMPKGNIGVTHVGCAEGDVLREWARVNMPGSEKRGGFFSRGYPLAQLYRCLECNRQLATIGDKVTATRKIARRWRLTHPDCAEVFELCLRGDDVDRPLQSRDELLITTAIADSHDQLVAETKRPIWTYLWPSGPRRPAPHDPAPSTTPPTPPVPAPFLPVSLMSFCPVGTSHYPAFPAAAPCRKGSVTALAAVEAQLAALRRSSLAPPPANAANPSFPVTISSEPTVTLPTYTAFKVVPPVATPAAYTAFKVAPPVATPALAPIVTTHKQGKQKRRRGQCGTPNCTLIDKCAP